MADDPWAEFSPSSAPESKPADPWAEFSPQGAPKAELTLGDVGKDVAKSAAIGVPKGIIGMAGLPEQIAGWTASGLGYLTGRDPESFRDQGDKRLPTTQDITKRVEDVTGPLYEPKTTYGKYAQTVGEFVPAAATGPGGIARNLIGGAVIPGLATEAAGQAAQAVAPATEPYVRGAAALLTGGRGATAAERSLVDANQARLMEYGPAATKGMYEGFDQVASQMPLDWKLKFQIGSQLRSDLQAKKLFEFNTKPAYDALKDLNEVKTIAGLASWRQAAREELYKEGMGRAAAAVTDVADQAIGQVTPMGLQVLKQADREFSTEALLRTLDKKFHGAEVGTAAANSAMNLDNKIRQALIAFQKNERAWHGLSPQDQVKILSVIKGGVPVNTLRYISNALGGGGGLGHSATVFMITALFGRVGGLMALGLGPALKALENRMTANQARNVLGSIAERSQFAPQFGRMTTSPALTAARTGMYGALAPQTAP